MKQRLLPLLLSLFIATSCCNNTDSMLASESDFEATVDGKEVQLFTMRNGDAIVQICNYGGRLVSFIVPDKYGKPTYVTWHEPTIEDCLNEVYEYNGVIIGRVTNRTGNNGRVTIDGKEYQLSLNDGNVSAHGGQIGFSRVVWDATEGRNEDGDPTVTLNYLSPDGEEGYPGNLNVTVTYTLKRDRELEIHYLATTDATTIVNLTSHPFLNLHGSWDKSTHSHQLTIHASQYTPSDSSGVLTGEIVPVEGTPLDFLTPHAIGERLDSDDPILARCDGYANNFVIDKPYGDYCLAVEMFEPSTGIMMELYTDQPAVLFYGGYYQGAATRAKGDAPSRPLRYGIALEAQQFPNAPNRPEFPSIELKPNERYEQRTSYKFLTK